MPYDITDAYLEIKELQQALGILVQKLREKKIIEEVKESGKEEKEVSTT